MVWLVIAVPRTSTGVTRRHQTSGAPIIHDIALNNPNTTNPIKIKIPILIGDLNMTQALIKTGIMIPVITHTEAQTTIKIKISILYGIHTKVQATNKTSTLIQIGVYKGI